MKLPDQRFMLELALCAMCCCATLLLDGTRARTELLWGDEIVSVRAIGLGIPDLAQHRYAGGHSPLYFILLKFWVLISSGVDSLARPNEFLLRLPSLILMGLAGGLLSATAWRAWGTTSGVLLLALWLGNNMIERYAVEARPYALLIFFLVAAVWSSTRLWLAKDAGQTTLFGAVATGSRILAAATIPVGVIAVLAMEACSIGIKGTGSYARFRTYRSCVVLIATITILAIYLPAIVRRSAGYWVESSSPLSWKSLASVAQNIFANGGSNIEGYPVVLVVSMIVPALALYGLAINRHCLPARLAAGLAIAVPAGLVVMSAFNSLMLSRYFIAAVPGVLLLAAAAAFGSPGRCRKFATVALACSAILVLAGGRNFIKRPATYPALLEFIKTLEPGEIVGAANGWEIWMITNYYLPAYTGHPVRMRLRRKPLAVADLPQDSKIYWLFSSRGSQAERHMFGALPVLCRYSLPDGDILVSGKSRSDLPASMLDCPPDSQ